MKSLLLLRHAKSDWDAPSTADHDRPLAPRGRQAAKRMGTFLARVGPLPDRALTSSALRARRTLALAARAGDWSCPVEESGALYMATPEAALAEVARQDDRVRVLLVVGHEPTWSEFAGLLVGGGEMRLPTAACARIDFDVESWRSVGFGAGTLVWLVTPKLVKRAGLA